MKTFIFTIALFTLRPVFSQVGVFTTDTATKKYFKLANPGKRVLAINTDIIKTTLYGLPNVGFMISPKKRWIIDITLAKSLNTKSIVNTDFPADVSVDYNYSNFKKDHWSLGCYYNLGSLGLTYSTYLGLGYSIFNSYTTFSNPNPGAQKLNPVDWNQRCIYFTMGSQLPVFSNLQIGWQAGIGNSKFNLKGSYNTEHIYNESLHRSGLYGYGKLLIQYLIF